MKPVSTKDKSTTASAILQRKRVSREAPMNLDQQKPTQTRDPGAQWQQQKRSRKSKASEGKREESVPACETRKGKERKRKRARA